MQRALLDRLVERGYCLAVGRLGGCLVALLDSLAQSAQRGAQAGGVGAIGGSAFRGLTGAFERRKMISHIAWLPFVCTARYSGEYRIRYSTGLSLDWSNGWRDIEGFNSNCDVVFHKPRRAPLRWRVRLESCEAAIRTGLQCKYRRPSLSGDSSFWITLRIGALIRSSGLF